MARRIAIDTDAFSMTATLNGSASADALWGILPLAAEAQVWGEEVYFPAPMHVDADDARATVPSGTLAFWPVGDCVCIFFGQTPYSPVNVMGELDGEPDAFAQVRQGQRIELRRA